MLLLFTFLFTSTVQVLRPEILILVQVAAALLAGFVVVSVVWKGVLPAIICTLGAVLMYNSIILPYYASSETVEAYIAATKFAYSSYLPEAVRIAANIHFMVGAFMVAFSMILAYKPSLLFTRNRPASSESEWSKYPVWHDNTLLADGRMEASVPVKNLMTDVDRYLLWRYEYVLAGIYGTPHLVRPEGLVPKDSTMLFRDKATGRLIGKARYTGFFM
jgi:hypothetical protein